MERFRLLATGIAEWSEFRLTTSTHSTKGVKKKQKRKEARYLP